jgi:hypothetical protein
MPVESYEKGEEQRCPICGAPYYAECEHMKHPEKFAEIKGKPGKIEIGTDLTDEALAVHKELKEKIGIPESTPEEIEKAVEEAFEKITEDERSLIADAIQEVINDNENDPAVQEFLEFEKRQPGLPKEVGRYKPVRESLIDSLSATFERLKSLYQKPEDLKEAIKKAALNRIRSRAEKGMFKAGLRR